MTCRCRSQATMVFALMWNSSDIPPANGTPTHRHPASSAATAGASIRFEPHHDARAVVVGASVAFTVSIPAADWLSVAGGVLRGHDADLALLIASSLAHAARSSSGTSRHGPLLPFSKQSLKHS